MAESSILAYVYVLFTGILLAIILFKIKKTPFKFTFNTVTKSTKEMTITRSTLLQFNATVIAGLFILLTIQGTMTENGLFIFIDYLASQEIKKEYGKIINGTSNDPLLKEEAKKRIVEIELNSARNLAKSNFENDVKLPKAFLQPLTYFSLSLAAMTISSLILICSRENSYKKSIAEGLIIPGLILILTGVSISMVYSLT